MRATCDFARQSDPDHNRQFRRQWGDGCRIDPAPASSRTAAAPTNESLAAAILLDWRRHKAEAL